MYGPAARRKRFRRSGGFAVLHQCIRPLIGAVCAPGHHGYQRACVLITGQASSGGHLGHQGSHAPGRPVLHLVSSSRRPRQENGTMSSLSPDRCSSFVRAVSRSFTPACACSGARRAGTVKAGCRAWLSTTSASPGHALYEAFQVKRYFTAFFTFFISVSLFDLESRFFAPTHTCWKSTGAGAVRAGRRSAPASARSLPGRALTAPAPVDTFVVVGMTRPRGARCRGTMDSRRNLVSGGSQ